MQLYCYCLATSTFCHLCILQGIDMRLVLSELWVEPPEKDLQTGVFYGNTARLLSVVAVAAVEQLHNAIVGVGVAATDVRTVADTLTDVHSPWFTDEVEVQVFKVNDKLLQVARFQLWSAPIINLLVRSWCNNSTGRSVCALLKDQSKSRKNGAWLRGSRSCAASFEAKVTEWQLSCITPLFITSWIFKYLTARIKSSVRGIHALGCDELPPPVPLLYYSGWECACCCQADNHMPQEKKRV